MLPNVPFKFPIIKGRIVDTDGVLLSCKPRCFVSFGSNRALFEATVPAQWLMA